MYSKIIICNCCRYPFVIRRNSSEQWCSSCLNGQSQILFSKTIPEQTLSKLNAEYIYEIVGYDLVIQNREECYASFGSYDYLRQITKYRSMTFVHQKAMADLEKSVYDPPCRSGEYRNSYDAQYYGEINRLESGLPF